MKSIISPVVLASVSLAQNSIIGLPTTGYTVTKGSNVTVQVQRLLVMHKSMLPVRLLSE
ncbi:hypothetical protein PENSUB_4236 [Penicillium subrubescens]|uniref:Uncharacterized protein n=1 Tax=Penicillium subrubescens TaxID=1316194 RepID=A0A1Q5UCW5_9EURO|nr:hypothetical protein PENSUB_4258 [Penicillium subrubescens]OKP10319.1 hypothetical protein PENSUB_4236 [Penicillium subrubescens]